MLIGAGVAAILELGIKGPIVISMSCGELGAGLAGKEYAACSESARNWQEEYNKKNRPKIFVYVRSNFPHSTSGYPQKTRLDEYREYLRQGSDEIDIFQIDVTWASALGEHFVDLGDYLNEHSDIHFDKSIHFPAMIKAGTFGNKLVAVPWSANFGVLYYNTHLLDSINEELKRDGPPRIWADLYKISERAMSKGKIGFIWPGGTNESLTCNALEWIHSFNGGLERDEHIIVNNSNAVEAITQAALWINHISPCSVMKEDDDSTLHAFEQANNIVFMRHWLSRLPSLVAEEANKGRYGISLLPTDNPPMSNQNPGQLGTLGGWLLAVSAHSRNREAAIKVAIGLAGYEAQKDRARYHRIPTIPKLFADDENMKQFFNSIRGGSDIRSALLAEDSAKIVRPSRLVGIHYEEFSRKFQEAVYCAITASQSDQDTAQKRIGIERILERFQNYMDNTFPNPGDYSPPCSADTAAGVFLCK